MARKDETNVDGSRAGVGFGARGRRLWAEVLATGELTPTEMTLLEEACRAADRLERLDALLRGNRSEWMHLSMPDIDGEVYVMIGNVLTEARQQQTTLKGLLAELRQSRGARTVPPPGQQGAQPAGERGEGVKPGVASVTSLAAHVAARQPAG